MKMILLFLSLMMTFTVQAGFEGLNQGASLKLFDGIDCREGLTCTRLKNKFLVKHTGEGVLIPQAAATATTITAAQCGSTFVNSGAVQMELPKLTESILGCRLTFVTGNASNFDINPDDADRIVFQTDADGDAIRNATVGNSIMIEAISTTQWVVVSRIGAWVDIN
jgi:hypothetical protein